MNESSLANTAPVTAYELLARDQCNMETPQVKQDIVRAIQDLPEDATVEDAIERLYFLATIEPGLEQSEAGNTVAHDEIKSRFL